VSDTPSGAAPRTPAPHQHQDSRSFLRRVYEFIHPGPDSKDELMETLAEAEDNHVIGAESRAMLEGVLRIADMTAGQVMVAAPRMDLIDIDAAADDIMRMVISTAHSRFPVFEGSRENIIGTLMAKDLLKLQRAPELNLRTLLRPAVFIPESKKLNDLLRDFRSRRNHLAMVIDEFGRTAGLVTIEDVLEEIVGEIEDEFDIDENDGAIYALADGLSWRVAGNTEVERVAEHFKVNLQADGEEQRFDTIAGLIAHELGHVPKRGDGYAKAGLVFTALHTVSGTVKWLKVTRV
jgi:magnesium and cobalt transporter